MINLKVGTLAVLKKYPQKLVSLEIYVFTVSFNLAKSYNNKQNLLQRWS